MTNRIGEGAAATIVRAPTGTTPSCKGWEQEAALRMLLNSADSDVAERSAGAPAGSDWRERLQATLAALRELGNEETLVVRSGRPAGVFRTQSEAPRVVIASEAQSDQGTGSPADWLYVGTQSALPVAYEVLGAVAQKHFGGTFAGRLVVVCGLGTVGGALPLAATLHGAALLGIEADTEQIKRRVKTGYCEVMVNDLDEALRILKNSVRKREPSSVGLIGNCADVLPELASRGVVPNLVLDCTMKAEPFGTYIPRGLSAPQAAEFRKSDTQANREKTLESIEAQLKSTLELQGLGSLVYQSGGGRQTTAPNPGWHEVSKVSDFSTEFVEPLFAEGRSLLLWVALSGEPADIMRADRLALEALAEDQAATRFLQLAGRHVQFQGLPARVCLVNRALPARFGRALNQAARQGTFRAPLLIGCDSGGHDDSATQLAEDARRIAGLNEAEFNALFASLSSNAKAASYVAVGHGDTSRIGRQFRLAMVADGTSAAGHRVERLLGQEASSA